MCHAISWFARETELATTVLGSSSSCATGRSSACECSLDLRHEIGVLDTSAGNYEFVSSQTLRPHSSETMDICCAKDLHSKLSKSSS